MIRASLKKRKNSIVPNFSLKKKRKEAFSSAIKTRSGEKKKRKKDRYNKMEDACISSIRSRDQFY